MRCEGCGREYKLDIMVPLEIWKKILPDMSKPKGGMLCGSCIVERIENMDRFLVVGMDMLMDVNGPYIAKGGKIDEEGEDLTKWSMEDLEKIRVEFKERLDMLEGLGPDDEYESIYGRESDEEYTRDWLQGMDEEIEKRKKEKLEREKEEVKA